MTELIPPGPEFAELFRTFEHTTFRLEVRDTYNSPNEQESLRQFRETGVVDQSKRTAWLQLVADSTRAGKVWRRVRVVTVPLTFYSEWGLRAMSLTAIATRYDRVDVTPPALSKATALDKVRRRLGVEYHATAAIGDGENGLEMLRWAGVAIAMGHAPGHVPGVAGRATGTIDEDGAAAALLSLLG